MQLETTYCVANIALWEDEKKPLNPVASITGAYLVTLLGSGNTSLQEACCWGILVPIRLIQANLDMFFSFSALGNMLPQSRTVLVSQGMVDKIVGLLKSPSSGVINAAIQCLTQLVTTCSPT